MQEGGWEAGRRGARPVWGGGAAGRWSLSRRRQVLGGVGGWCGGGKQHAGVDLPAGHRRRLPGSPTAGPCRARSAWLARPAVGSAGGSAWHHRRWQLSSPSRWRSLQQLACLSEQVVKISWVLLVEQTRHGHIGQLQGPEGPASAGEQQPMLHALFCLACCAQLFTRPPVPPPRPAACQLPPKAGLS